MLRKSRAKKLVDASYNRFAWNDPTDLPEWFVDDEQKHYRPQLPLPKALLDSLKQRFEDLTSKPIKKVAEARARKRKRSADKLKAAKKKAEALSNTDGMSDKEKLKAIAKVSPTPFPFSGHLLVVCVWMLQPDSCSLLRSPSHFYFSFGDAHWTSHDDVRL